MFSYLDFGCYFKANAQNHIYFPPVILRSPYKEEEEEEEEKEKVPLFIIHSFIHITYYITTRYEIKPASKLKE